MYAGWPRDASAFWREAARDRLARACEASDIEEPDRPSLAQPLINCAPV